MPPLNYYNQSQQEDLICFAEGVIRYFQNAKHRDDIDKFIYVKEYIQDLGEELIEIICGP